MSEPYDETVFSAIETRPWDEVRSLQEDRLREQVEYLASESDYYRSKFREWDVDPSDVRSFEDLAAVPFTVKDDERRNQDRPTTEQPLGTHQAARREDLRRVMSSSGTTGEPTFFGLTGSDWEAWREMAARAVYACGVRPDDVILHGNGRTMVPGGIPYIEAMEHVGAAVVPAGDGDTERILKTAEKLSVDGLFTTASYLQYIVDRAPEVVGREVDELNLRKLIGGGEPGMANPEIRAQLYDAYDAERAAEAMGLGDVGAALAGECEEERGMHLVCQEHVLVELVDPDTDEPIDLEAGAEGELVYTPLTREATPLLRFRSGDYARVTATDCSCGRTSPRIQVIGRADDMLIYKAQNVYPAGIREVVADVEGASPRMKVVLPRAGKVRFDDPIPVEVARDEETPRSEEAIADEIAGEVRRRLKVRVAPRIVDPADIELSVYKTDLVRVADE